MVVLGVRCITRQKEERSCVTKVSFMVLTKEARWLPIHYVHALYELVANSLVSHLLKKKLSRKGNPSSSLLTTLPHWMLGFLFHVFSPIFSYTSTHLQKHGYLFTQVINWVKHVCKTKPNLKPNQASQISRSLQNRRFYKSKNPFSKWHPRFCCCNNNNKIRLDYSFL